MSDPTAADDWLEEAWQALRTLRGARPGWGYRAGAAPAVEPTALAGLAALGAGRGDEPAVREAADWLARLQRPDGALGVAEGLAAPGWPTSYALLLWRGADSHADARRRASAWLLRSAGNAAPPGDDPDHVIGHDMTLVGWPWVAGTHSWLEPTALAVLALRREGLGGHPRVVEGLRVIRDRAIDGGGWNAGNKAVFGRALRPLPVPTGMALLALAGAGPRGPIVDRAVTYLRAILPGVRAAGSLGWGLLGLRAWGEAPEAAPLWLRDAARRVVGRPDAAPRLALLLLAAGEGAPALFNGPDGEPPRSSNVARSR